MNADLRSAIAQRSFEKFERRHYIAVESEYYVELRDLQWRVDICGALWVASVFPDAQRIMSHLSNEDGTPGVDRISDLDILAPFTPWSYEDLLWMDCTFDRSMAIFMNDCADYATAYAAKFPNPKDRIKDMLQSIIDHNGDFVRSPL